MSELKSYDLVDIQDYRGEVYLKYEADKVIAELKNEIETQKRLRDMALASVPNALKVAKIIQHNKYKRCLSMAMYCERQQILCYMSIILHRYDFYVKWHKRWLELAEKFKEAK